jgi:hypothetical protein
MATPRIKKDKQGHPPVFREEGGDPALPTRRGDPQRRNRAANLPKNDNWLMMSKIRSLPNTIMRASPVSAWAVCNAPENAHNFKMNPGEVNGKSKP